MARWIVRTLLVCSLFFPLLTCKKAEETAAAPETASAPAPPPKASVPVPQACGGATTNCTGALSGSQCATSITAAQANIPAEACQVRQSQDFVDIYSWNAFVALNWPANISQCAADTAKSILTVQSGDGTYVVWQTYMPGENVFVDPATQKPAPWCGGNGLALGAQRVFDNESKAESVAAKLGGDFLKISEPSDVKQAAGGVVTDQSGRWLRYEKLMNRAEYDYVTADRWNAPQLQKMKDANDPIKIPPGSIEVKASWKVLTTDEIEKKRYYTTQATVCNNPGGDRTPCDEKPVTLGLVGLHIVQRTPTAATMFWSTFEHVDNDQVFFDPTSNAAPNTSFAKEPFTELDANCKPVNAPTQIKRLTPVPANAEINQYYQSLLGGSVFANYQLISTQWATGLVRTGVPQNVANTTMETYVQLRSKETKMGKATGCFSCHLESRTAIAGQDGDHSFFFLEAKGK